MPSSGLSITSAPLLINCALVEHAAPRLALAALAPRTARQAAEAMNSTAIVAGDKRVTVRRGTATAACFPAKEYMAQCRGCLRNVAAASWLPRMHPRHERVSAGSADIPVSSAGSNGLASVGILQQQCLMSVLY